MITTKNRAGDLRRTCQVLRRLDPPPLEVIITADGCSDDTVEVASRELPGVRLFVNELGQGSVVSRDRMIREARGDLVLALDDDSYPEQLDCIARFVPIFENRSQLAVLHFPQRTDEYPETLAQTDFGQEHLTRSFANSGAVIRRSTYLQLPGFEPKFSHMYEEPDYALQCVAAGYEVLFSPIVTIRHHYSGQVRERNTESSSSCSQRDVERVVAMPLSIRRANGALPRAVAISVCMPKRDQLGDSRADLVVASYSRSSVQPGKTSASSVGGL